MSIETKFDIGDEVKIAPLEFTAGLILAISKDTFGVWHKTRYFSLGKAEEVWFLENELKRKGETP